MAGALVDAGVESSTSSDGHSSCGFDDPTLGCVSPSVALMFKTYFNAYTPERLISECLPFMLFWICGDHICNCITTKLHSLLVECELELVELESNNACAARIGSPSCWKSPPSLSVKHRAHRWPSE